MLRGPTAGLMCTESAKSFRCKRPYRVAGLALAVCAATAAAQDSLVAPEVEVTGHYDFGIGTSDAASAGAVTAKRIETRPVLREGEVLETIPGLIVTQHSGDGKGNQYFLRGFNLDHGTDFAVSIDGMPVNFPTHGHGQGYADMGFLIPELIGRIDFGKGPYFASRGDFASAGYADISLANTLGEGLGKITLGRFDYRRGLLVNAPELADGTLLYAVEYQEYDGPWDNPNDYQKLNGVLRYSRGSSQSGFSITGMAYSADWNATDQIPQRAVDQGLIGRFAAIDPTDGGESSRYSLSVRAFDQMDDWGWKVDAYALRYKMNLWSNFTYFIEDPVNGDQFEQADDRSVFGLHPRTTFFHELGGSDSATTFGVKLRYDDIYTVGLYTTRARQRLDVTREDRVKQSSAGLYAENSTYWTQWFRTVAGVRADFYRFDVNSNIPENSGKLSDEIYSPKLSMIFGPWAKTEYFANVGYGFHSNDARGTVITVDPGTLAPVDRVNPLVKTRGEEIGVRTEIVPGLQSTLAFWRLKMDSELLFVGDAGATEASRPSERRGVEWSNHWIFAERYLLDVDLAWSRARFTDGDTAGDRIPGAIEKIASVGMSVVDVGPWSGTVLLRHFGSRPLVEDNSVRSGGTTLVNLRAGYRIDRRWNVGLDVFNLFDRKANDIDYFYASQMAGEGAPVEDVHFHPVEPRHFRVTLSGRF